jgi:hypothetical protein
MSESMKKREDETQTSFLCYYKQHMTVCKCLLQTKGKALRRDVYAGR